MYLEMLRKVIKQHINVGNNYLVVLMFSTAIGISFVKFSGERKRRWRGGEGRREEALFPTLSVKSFTNEINGSQRCVPFPSR